MNRLKEAIRQAQALKEKTIQVRDLPKSVMSTLNTLDLVRNIVGVTEDSRFLTVVVDFDVRASTSIVRKLVSDKAFDGLVKMGNNTALRFSKDKA